MAMAVDLAVMMVVVVVVILLLPQYVLWFWPCKGSFYCEEQASFYLAGDDQRGTYSVMMQLM